LSNSSNILDWDFKQPQKREPSDLKATRNHHLAASAASKAINGEKLRQEGQEGMKLTRNGLSANERNRSGQSKEARAQRPGEVAMLQMENTQRAEAKEHLSELAYHNLTADDLKKLQDSFNLHAQDRGWYASQLSARLLHPQMKQVARSSPKHPHQVLSLSQRTVQTQEGQKHLHQVLQSTQPLVTSVTNPARFQIPIRHRAKPTILNHRQLTKKFRKQNESLEL
jgi:hypothetical protein